MDGFRQQLATMQETLRDVVGRLNALEQRAVTANVVPTTPKVKPELSTTLSDVKPTSAQATRKP